MATLSVVSEILRISYQNDKNTRLKSDLKQVPLVGSAETTHHRPAIPAVVSTSRSSGVVADDTKCAFLRGERGKRHNTEIGYAV